MFSQPNLPKSPIFSFSLSLALHPILIITAVMEMDFAQPAFSMVPESFVDYSLLPST